MKLSWLLSLLVSSVGTCNIIAFNGKELLDDKRTAYQIDSRILPNPLAIQRSLKRDDPADLDKPAIPVPENETRHAPTNRDTVHVEIVVTHPNRPSSQQHRKEELPTPNHDPITETATSSSETGDESRNPAPVNRAIAGMSAGLVGVMVIFTVFL